MLTPKRAALMLAAIAFVSSLVVIIATVQAGKNPAPSEGDKIKVFRRKSERGARPNAAEVANFKRQQGKEEREVEDKVPKRVPIKIKLKADKEKAFKDMSNEDWERDFELEVTNTSSKPIYYLELLVSFPEILSERNHPIGVPLEYGRQDFMDFNVRPQPADIPIPPGGSYIFKISDLDQEAYKWHRAHENRRDPKKVEVLFVQLNFGDGTGFNGISAAPYPYQRTSSNIPC